MERTPSFRSSATLVWVAVTAAVILLARQAEAAGNRHALLIGLNQYRAAGDVVELRYAVNDVDALAARLRTDGYEVHTMVNGRATRRDILEELQRYAITLRPADTFVLFFAGHGVRRQWGEPHTYWLTYDTDLRYLDQEGIRLAHLLEYVQDIPAGRKLVLLDHCFSGTIGLRMAPGSSPVEVSGSTGGAATSTEPRSGAEGTRAAGVSSSTLTRSPLPQSEFASQLAPSSGMVVLAAAGDEAYELEQFEHGAFTEALLRAMRSREASGGKESLTLQQLSAFVNTTVRTLTSDRQRVSERVNGFRLGEWEFISSLPVGDLQEAQNRRTAYLAKLNTWERERHLDLQTFIWCEEALNARVESMRTNTRLDARFEAIAAEIDRFMTLVGPSATIGPRLQARILEIREQP